MSVSSLSVSLGQWLKVSLFHLRQVFEGYGQTECTAAATITVPGDVKSGHVGVPIPCTLVKLVDVPEMNYFAENGEGEVPYPLLC